MKHATDLTLPTELRLATRLNTLYWLRLTSWCLLLWWLGNWKHYYFLSEFVCCRFKEDENIGCTMTQRLYVHHQRRIVQCAQVSSSNQPVGQSINQSLHSYVIRKTMVWFRIDCVIINMFNHTTDRCWLNCSSSSHQIASSCRYWCEIQPAGWWQISHIFLSLNNRCERRRQLELVYAAGQ